MKIFFIGFMCSGKTTLGRQLAEELRLPFFDLDDEVEKSNGETIEEIFETRGEATFREMERDELKDLVANQRKFVIATGGGTPCFFDNMKLMLQAGHVVYLDVPVAALLQRISASKASRPLVFGLQADDLKKFTEDKVLERSQVYINAHHILSGENISLRDAMNLPFL
ncbi:MAG: shikimate kinase [Flavobacteriales bacterium]